ncbi:MAG: hypothetical protein DRH17_03775 [Deltaproteobacteria bacterium]|nr:MAG: hypothetical protein DRH17_03775 [Deltaproteobacteria bacterium]
MRYCFSDTPIHLFSGMATIIVCSVCGNIDDLKGSGNKKSFLNQGISISFFQKKPLVKSSRMFVEALPA